MLLKIVKFVATQLEILYPGYTSKKSWNNNSQQVKTAFRQFYGDEVIKIKLNFFSLKSMILLSLKIINRGNNQYNTLF